MQSFGEENQYPTASIHWSSIQKINPRRPWGTIHEPPSPLGDVCFNYGVDKVKKKNWQYVKQEKGSTKLRHGPRFLNCFYARFVNKKIQDIFLCLYANFHFTLLQALFNSCKLRKKNPQDFCVVFMEEHKRVECSQTYRNFNTYKSSVCRITGRSK